MTPRPETIPWVIGHGVPVVIEVIGGSMAPAIAKGARVQVEALAGDPRVGEIVLVANAGHALPTLHRVMHVFSYGGVTHVVHQGDAPSSTFAICARSAVLARAKAFAAESPRPLPLPPFADSAAQSRFMRRRLACVAFVTGRALITGLGFGAGSPLARRCARLYRAVARRVAG